MIDIISPAATNDHHIAYNPLFLEEYSNPEQPAREIRNPLEFPHGVPLADSSSEEGIHKQKSFELVDATFKPEGIIGLRQHLFMEEQAIAMISHVYMNADPDFPTFMRAPRVDSRVFRPSFWEMASPATDAGQEYADPSAILYSHRRRVLEQSVFLSPWGVGSVFQPRSSGTEFPAATADLAHPSKNTVLYQILEQLDAVFRWREDWDGEERVAEKPSGQAIDKAKQVVGELLGAVISQSKPLDTPVISYGYDGYISMVWRNGKHELYIEVNEDEIEYVKVWGANIDSEMDAGIPNKDNYLTLWEWLLDG